MVVFFFKHGQAASPLCIFWSLKKYWYLLDNCINIILNTPNMITWMTRSTDCVSRCLLVRSEVTTQQSSVVNTNTHLSSLIRMKQTRPAKIKFARALHILKLAVLLCDHDLTSSTSPRAPYHITGLHEIPGLRPQEKSLRNFEP